MITDAQVHLWAAHTPQRPWPAGAHAPHRLIPLGKDELLQEMHRAGVDRAILVPPSWEGSYNDLVIDAAQRHPDRFGVMARVSIERPESRHLLGTLRNQRGVLGIRLVFSRGPSLGWLRDGTADWIWPEAERLELPVMVFPPGQIQAIAGVAERHPNLRLVIDHLGLGTDLRDQDIDPAIDDVLTLARLENVAVKASSLPSYVTESYPFRSLHARVRRVVNEFGRERVFWGSDVSRLPCPYREAVTLFTEELPFLSEHDLTWVMSRGVSQWLRWPEDGRPA